MRLYRLADKLIAFSFYLLFFLVPLVFSPAGSELFELPKMVLTYVLTAVITSSWAIKSITSGRLIFRRTPLDIPLLLLLCTHLLSTYLSIDPHTSIWGYYTRSHGGLLSTVSYMLLYWAFVSNMSRRNILLSIYYLLLSATLVAIWGVLEHFGLSPSCLILRGNLGVDCWVQDVQTRVFATLGQPNWLAAWLVALSPIAWALALNSKLKSQKSKLQLKTKNLIWLILSGLFFLALLYTKSRSGLLGFAAAYAVFWGALFLTSHLPLRNPLRTTNFLPPLEARALRNFLLFTVVYLLLSGLGGSPWTPSLGELTTHYSPRNSLPTTSHYWRRVHTSPPTSTTLETDITPSAEIRKIVWRGAIDAWRAYPLFGSGVETFAYVYYQFRPIEHNLTSEWDFLYNKAHNEYLNFLTTTGVVGLGTYLLLIVVSLRLLMRISANAAKGHLRGGLGLIEGGGIGGQRISTNMRILATALLAGYVSILVTNFFGFSVVPVAMLFFLFPGFAFALTHIQPPTSKPTSHLPPLTSKQLVFLAFVLFTTFYVLLRLGGVWYADVLYARAKEQNKAGEVGRAIENAQQALRLRPQEPNYWDELAQGWGLLAASLALDGQFNEAEGLAEAADQASKKALDTSPRNVSLLKSRAVVMNQLADVDEKYLYEGINTLERARTLAPTEPKIHYNLGVLYSRVGQEEQAREFLEKALELKPDYEDPKEALKALQ